MSYEVFRQAILARKPVTCLYHGRPREVCPHTLGTKNGREKVLSFQYGGESSRGLPPGGEWRCMFVDEVSNAVQIEGPWHTRDDHSRPQTCVDSVDVETS